MSYRLLDTCFGVPGVSEANCASWVQAWGSLLGLAIAIGLPLWLHTREARRRRRDEEASALVVAAGLLLVVDHTIGAAKTLANGMQNFKPGHGGLEMRLVESVLGSITFPSQDELLRMEPVDREVSLALARGSTYLYQVSGAVRMLSTLRETDEIRGQVAALLPTVLQAQQEYEFAVERLRAFIDGRQSRGQ